MDRRLLTNQLEYRIINAFSLTIKDAFIIISTVTMISDNCGRYF